MKSLILAGSLTRIGHAASLLGEEPGLAHTKYVCR